MVRACSSVGIEQDTHNVKVIGSSPVRPTKEFFFSKKYIKNVKLLYKVCYIYNEEV